MPKRRKKKTKKKAKTLKKQGFVRAKGNNTSKFNFHVSGVKKIKGQQVRVFKDTDKDGRKG